MGFDTILETRDAFRRSLALVEELANEITGRYERLQRAVRDRRLEMNNVFELRGT